MSDFEELLKKIDLSDDYEENSMILDLLVQTIKSSPDEVSAEDGVVIKNFVFDEMQKLTALIPAAQPYKQKDLLFEYYARLIALVSLVSDKAQLSDGDCEIIQTLNGIVSSERVVENAVNDVFAHEIVLKEDIAAVVETLKNLTDEYQRGEFFNVLLHNSEKFSKVSDGAKTALAAYTASEIDRFIAEGLTEDKINALEIAVDVAKHYLNEKLAQALTRVLSLENNGVRLFATETLLRCGYGVPQTVIDEIAHDLRYAYLLLYTLAEAGKPELFPEELENDEYIAKSDMVQWLAYPTELNGVPEEIELIGTAKHKKEIFHIFKYKSHSDNLTDELKGEWLIGWSSTEGGTFSEFDLLKNYEKDTPEKTVKNIMKQLIIG